jgi:hypothetical protein
MPSLKARAEWLPWALKCIRENSGNYEKMQDCILTNWRNISQRTKPPTERNALRAVFGPSLRHLQLVMGEGDSITLMSKGKELLEIYERGGESEFKRLLAKHLLKLEKERWVGIALELQKFSRGVSEDEFLTHLSSTYNTDVSRDKLRKMLLYYSYVGLVKIEGRNITLREKQLKALLEGIDVELSDEEFIKALATAYEKLRATSSAEKLSPTLSASPYVPIPDLRETVCEMTGIWPDEFYRRLEAIPKETDSYLIHLSQPMMRKPGGIRIGGKYLYYAAIYKKRGDSNG